MGEYYCVFLDWRPISVVPTQSKTLKTIKNLFIAEMELEVSSGNYVEKCMARDLVYMNNGFFLFSICFKSATDTSQMIRLAQRISHKLKDNKLRHTHCFHIEETHYANSQPILIDTHSNKYTSEDALSFMKEKCRDESALAGLAAQPIKYSQGFGALELFKMQLSENTEKIHAAYTKDLKPTILTSKGSTFITWTSYFSIVSLVLYILYDLALGSFGETGLVPYVLTIFVMLSFVAVFLRSQYNIQLTKYLILSKGHAERSGLAAKMISVWLHGNQAMPEADLSSGITQLIDYEKEKGEKYRMQTVAFLSVAGLALVIYGFSIEN